jgi:hypothetical protein
VNAQATAAAAAAAAAVVVVVVLELGIEILQYDRQACTLCQL